MKEGLTMTDEIEEQILRNVDAPIRSLVQQLREHGIDTEWSCGGEPGHMTIRPTILARTGHGTSYDYLHTIDLVMTEQGIAHYWVSLLVSRGAVDTHRGEMRWMIEIPGRFDSMGFPVSLSCDMQREEADDGR